ncbi:NAD(P)/FAD-dependent oxidoreductase [Arthrobacter sp. H-02-3]|uniref:NAD(P)/FAD-dependent oxidoreductase n=1 Tax=Arthrobacter sp. H-02-3 TaxID=2703675 RepID=UPI000DD20D87|nr:FAD-dependent oxidoreductase [Arthrobacter sp. H-02-3]PVZ53665.1 ferredoxin reductase [Arthrobacter sp. H-02-3]
MSSRIVVAGASMGGLRAAEQLRAAGWEGEIVVVGEEAHPPYNRPPLSKALLAAPGTPEEALAAVQFRPRASATGIEWRLGTGIVAADLAARTVTLGSGESISYDGLVIATGLRPARIVAPGPLGGRHVVRSLEDTLALHKELVPGARVLVVGSGFIGCEVAATASELGCSTVLVEGASGPMERSLGKELADGVRGFLNARGVETHSGARVTEFLTKENGNDAGTCGGVVLSDGTRLAADVVVEAVGSHPNTEWLQGNGLDLSDGVLCDEHLRVVNAGPVVAVGDVARFPDLRTGAGARRVEHWAIPTDTAKIAAPALLAYLAGEDPPAASAPLPSFWTDLFKIRIQGVGSPALADSVEVFEGDASAPEAGVAVGYFRAGRLIGAVTAGLPAGIQLRYRTAVLNQEPPGALAVAPGVASRT